MKCDLRREEEILAMFELIKKEYGGVDVCINNAGCAVSPDSILSGSTDSWRTQLEVYYRDRENTLRDSVNAFNCFYPR